MSRHLCIDCGNTLVKAAVFSGDEIIARAQTDYDHLAPIVELSGKANPDAALLSSTTSLSTRVMQAVNPVLQCRLVELSHETSLPLSIAYRTPETLGRDRIAAAVGAWEMFPGCNLMIVDAGTCITMDVVTASGTYLGGNIAPGVEMRIHAMHDYTSRLPLINVQGDVPLVGYDTGTALRAGAILGASREIQGMAQNLRSMLGQLKVILTGGTAQLLAEYLSQENNTIENDLVMRGLNAIITFNEE